MKPTPEQLRALQTLTTGFIRYRKGGYWIPQALYEQGPEAFEEATHAWVHADPATPRPSFSIGTIRALIKHGWAEPDFTAGLLPSGQFAGIIITNAGKTVFLETQEAIV